MLVAALAGCGGTDEGAPTPIGSMAAESAAPEAPGADVQTAPKAFVDEMLGAANATRATARDCGASTLPAAGPLAWNPQAEQAALGHATYLQRNDLFTHAGENGSNAGDRLGATGYAWRQAGENIAAGFDGIAAVMQAWIDSPSHCTTLMNPAFTEVGVVLVPGTASNTYRSYWVMVLARPRS
jgi:uncharacterized protein YkwD